jgi:hypothetical protein
MHNQLECREWRREARVLALASTRSDPPMIDIRIVCTHDAVGFAETLMRLLAAEEHQVRLTYGRTSISALEEAVAERDAVLLIWSYEAPGQHYMLEWARGIDPSRLVEIARAPGAPLSDRRAHPIDFSAWRGERGGRAWNTLNDRLRSVSRAMEPPKPAQMRAAVAMGLMSAAAVTGALFLRANEPGIAAAPEQMAATNEISEIAVGGPLFAVEPASMDETIPFRARAYRVAPLPVQPEPVLLEIPVYEEPDLRDPTFIERLASLNPLRRDEEGY